MLRRISERGSELSALTQKIRGIMFPLVEKILWGDMKKTTR